MFTETLELHKQQLQATESHEKQAVRRSQLVKLREKIIEVRENAKAAEIDADLLEQ